MSVIALQIKRISAFVYVLLLLLAFNLVFNIWFEWYGVSLIVRVYLFVFAFYLIFNYASFGNERIRKLYSSRFGRHGDIVLFFELGVVPYLFIYGITIVFTFIDYIRLPNWPWNPLLSLLNGRYSNLVIYSLILFLVLKIRRGPGIKIAVFVGISILYFFLDKLLYSLIPFGPGVVVIKVLKFVVIFYFLLYEFFEERSKFALVAIAVSAAVAIVFSIIGIYALVFRYSSPMSYQKKESGILLLQVGYNNTAGALRRIIVEKRDIDLFKRVSDMDRGTLLVFNKTQWGDLILAGPMKTADAVARHAEGKEVELAYGRIISYVERESKKPDRELESASYLNRLAARSLAGHEEEFQRFTAGADRKMKLWGMAVMGERGDIRFVPFLIDYLTDIDTNVRDAAYEALRKITGLDPADTRSIARNDPEVLFRFKEHFLRNRRGR